MIKEIIEQWEINKIKLEDYFRITKQSEFSYENIFKKLFKLVIKGYDVSKITIVDNGNYQGTLIFLIPEDTYQPTEKEYLTTNCYYGSCSGCDTLQAISDYSDDLPNENQIKQYMTIALHLVQRLKILDDSEDVN